MLSHDIIEATPHLSVLREKNLYVASSSGHKVHAGKDHQRARVAHPRLRSAHYTGVVVKWAPRPHFPSDMGPMLVIWRVAHPRLQSAHYTGVVVKWAPRPHFPSDMGPGGPISLVTWGPC